MNILNVVCLKHGTKYDYTYVNNLFSMVSRHLTMNFDFVCITEDSFGIDPRIRVVPLDIKDQISGWWYKPIIFNPELGIKGTILFLDLDVIVFNNIDKLFYYNSNDFCIIEDFYAKRNRKNGMNSSCFRFESGSYSEVYYDFMSNSSNIMKSMHGDQDWIQSKIKENYSYWPHSWIKSYKWEMCLEKNIRKVADRYIVNQEPKIENENCIAVFHGCPKPHQIDQSWCIENWR